MTIIYHFAAPAEDSRQVDVVFVQDGAPVHRRAVNAVFVDGVFSDLATEDVVASVANGVEAKLLVGAIMPLSNEDYSPENADAWVDAAIARASARATRLAPEQE